MNPAATGNTSPLSSIRIAVLMGGPGSEREVSLVSGRAVLRALTEAGLNAVPVEIHGTRLDLPAHTGLAFNLIHGTFGEDGAIQQALENLGIPYTGAGVASSRLAFDKQQAKLRFLEHGVPTPNSEFLPATHPPAQPSFPLPFVVKPPCEGSSVGVHIVRNPGEIPAALADAARHGGDVLVEEYIHGWELTVGILGETALPVIHIIPPDGVYDMASKYPWLSGTTGSQYICPADLDESTTRAVQNAALAAHRCLGIEVYSRVDLLLDSSGKPYVLEANTIPGMTETSLLPKAAAAAGIPFPDLCRIIAERSLERFPS